MAGINFSSSLSWPQLLFIIAAAAAAAGALRFLRTPPEFAGFDVDDISDDDRQVPDDRQMQVENVVNINQQPPQLPEHPLPPNEFPVPNEEDFDEEAILNEIEMLFAAPNPFAIVADGANVVNINQQPPQGQLPPQQLPQNDADANFQLPNIAIENALENAIATLRTSISERGPTPDSSSGSTSTPPSADQSIFQPKSLRIQIPEESLIRLLSDKQHLMESMNVGLNILLRPNERNPEIEIVPAVSSVGIGALFLAYYHIKNRYCSEE